MPIIDPDQGVPLPAGTDLADNPAAFSNFYTPVLSRQNNRYTDEANRTALHPANINGEESYLTASGRKELNNGSVWLPSDVSSSFFYNVLSADIPAISSQTVMQNVTGLSTTLNAAGMWQFWGLIYYDSSTTADIKIGFSAPLVTGGRWSTTGLALGAATREASMRIDLTTVVPAGTLTAGGIGVGAGNSVYISYEGRIITSGSTVFQMQYAQNTSDPTNTQIRSGSWLRINRLP